jgi:hypothetical protein
MIKTPADILAEAVIYNEIGRILISVGDRQELDILYKWLIYLQEKTKADKKLLG